MKSLLEEKITTFLIFLTIILAIAFLVYYSINSNIQNYKYSDKEEYENVERGLNFIKKLPIHFNILNSSFHDMNTLKQEEKEQILIGYYLKNGMVEDCKDREEDICIYEENLKKEKVFEKFNTKINFKSNKLNIYLDGYGLETLYKKKSNNTAYYQMHIKEEKDVYAMFTSFKYFKKSKDSYNFYVYQGYYNRNNVNQYELKDLIKDKVIYKEDVRNELFEHITDKEIKQLQLYKYILKKNKNGEYYLYGFTPVKS